MRLSAAIDQAERFAQLGDDESASLELERALPDVALTEDVALLEAFAKACHRWGSSEAEEAALRAALARRRSLDALLSLLDVLQQRLNVLKGASRLEVVVECEALGTEALAVLGASSGLEWSNIVRTRGLRRLELVRSGRLDRIDEARGDLKAHRAWLVRDEDVPAHLQRGNLLALVDIDLAELLVLEGRAAEAIERLERAISVLESAGAGKWMTERAYRILELALELPAAT